MAEKTYTLTLHEVECLLDDLAHEIARAKNNNIKVAYYEAAKRVAACLHDPELIIYVNITLQQIEYNLL